MTTPTRKTEYAPTVIILLWVLYLVVWAIMLIGAIHG